MAISLALGLPDLARISCPDCEGAGGYEVDHPATVWSCKRCNGRGELEVCEGCYFEPTIRQGAEFCGCAVPAELGRVA